MNDIKLFTKTLRYSLELAWRSSRFLIFVYLVLGVTATTIPLFHAFIFQYFLDELIAAAPNIRKCALCLILYISSFVLLHVIDSVLGILKDSITKKAEHQYDCDLFETLIKLPMAFLDTSEGKDMIDDAGYTKKSAVLFVDRIFDMVLLVYTFVVAFGTIAHFSICFALILLACSVPGIILNRVFHNKAEELRLKTAPDKRKFSYYRWMLTDSWPAKDVRMYNLTDVIKERYNTEKNAYRKENKKLDQKRLSGDVAADLLVRAGEFSFILYTVFMTLKAQISVGEMTLYIGFVYTVQSSFKRMCTLFYYGVVITLHRMKRYFDFLQMKCEEDDAETERRTLGEFESLCFNDVYFKYPSSDHYVLSGPSFTLNRGDRLSIVGINGSGKSTIIKLMLGLYEVDKGEILVNGYPIHDYRMAEVRKLFSVLFQSFVQYPLSLRDNIALSDYERSGEDDEIEEALKQSGVYDEIMPKLESGLDSYMTRSFDDRGVVLSKGQWQKVALSRVYFKNAPILICDEPSASLDAEAEDQIFRSFHELSDSKTAVMISHRISSARMASKIIVLDGGKIIEQGTHHELVASGGLYAKLYQLQKEKYVNTEGEPHE